MNVLLSCTDKTKDNEVSIMNIDYSNVKHAEESIINGNFIEALEYYNNIEHYYAVDCYNALNCAIEIGNWKEANKWSVKLIKLGAVKNFFNQKKFEHYKNTNYWKEIYNNYDYYYESFLKSRNSKLIHELEELIAEDQIEYCGLPTGESNLEEVFDKTKSIDLKLIELLKKYGFFAEKMISFNIKKDTIISPLPKFYGLMRHSFQSNSKLFYDKLNNAVKEGKLKKEIFNAISNSPSSHNTIIKYNDEFYETNNNSATEYELYKRKIEYNYCNTSSKYILYAPYSILNFKDSVSSKLFMNNMNLIKLKIFCK